MMAALPLFSMALGAAPVQAQQYNMMNGLEPRIDGFNVDEVRRIAPGVELNFSVYGSPGATVILRIAGARRNLTLIEVDRGQYEGVYTVGYGERITGQSAVTANLRIGNKVASGVLSESLLRDVGRHASARPRAPMPDLRIERFDVRGSDDLSAGNELDFTVLGTPGAKVDMSIAGTRGVFFLSEAKPGEYTGSYLIRRHDRISSDSVVTATLRVGDRLTTATLGKPLQSAGGGAPVARHCTNCATVEAINLVEVNGDGSYLGTVGGGVVGALLGSQVGSGNGRTAAQVAGAVGGAYVGRNIERNANRTEHYEVLVRFPAGGSQTVVYENDPGLRVGEKVKVNNGVLTRDQ